LLRLDTGRFFQPGIFGKPWDVSGPHLNLFPLAGRQPVKLPWPYGDAYQTQSGISDGSRHATYLAIAAFTKGQHNPAAGNVGAVTYGRLALPHDGISQFLRFCG